MNARGEMLWFNNDKKYGFIATDEGERVRVDATAFADGPPTGRCAGRPVAFQTIGNGETAAAVDVIFVDDDAPRRARMRRSAR